jgi:uncharacterized protein YggE
MKILRLTAFLTLATAVPLTAQQIAISKENKTIAISTSDDASALADIAVVTVGFNSYGKDQDGTYADATKTSNAIISALTTAGVPKDAIQSSSQSLSPIDPDSNADKVRYAQGLRFEFAQRWHVTVAAGQAANILHLAITSGANNSGGIDWQLENEDELQAEAAKKALKHARQIAESMAAGLGTKLGQLVYASNQMPPSDALEEDRFRGVPGGILADAPPPPPSVKPLAITPERITKSATVYAVFSIE